MSPKVKITYGGSRSKKSPQASSSPPPIPPPTAVKRKRPLEDQVNTQLKKRAKGNPTKAVAKQKSLTQLHFSIDTTVLRTCAVCQLSYTKGAPDDESLHRAHCARVKRGMEWGKEEEREKFKTEIREVLNGIKLKDGKTGRIVCFRADIGGKVGTKLNTLLETINRALSSPSLLSSALRESKAYLFLLPSTVSSREKIVGCVIAQRIKTAMAVVVDPPPSANERDSTSDVPRKLIPVDSSSSLYCHPEPLPTPLGIPRLFVSYAHRRQGIATHLLTAAAEDFIHGCRLDPSKGQVAFTQPTGLGGMVMKKWGGGGVRIYEE